MSLFTVKLFKLNNFSEIILSKIANADIEYMCVEVRGHEEIWIKTKQNS